ncbi:MAG TPA: thiol:disulfide interchange protein DsbG [Gammaproteobacteria bacterium]|nr:thiol:disulfide interchange protein DsbG [Gammaproteobacteria bacterium]
MPSNAPSVRWIAALALLGGLLAAAVLLPDPQGATPEPGSGTSAESASAESGEVPPAVQALTERGLQLAERFAAPGGLIGYTGRAGGRQVVVYATPDGGHAVIGTMVDASGRDLSSEQLKAHPAEPDRSEAWGRLEDAHWFATGAEDPKRVVYMFTDPFCPYCNAIWRASRPYYGEGLQIRHLLVGVIRPSSADKAAAILQSDRPAAAFRRHQAHYGEPGEDQLPAQISDDARAAVQANNRLMSRLGVSGTPAVFYRTADGTVKLASGMPPLSQLADIYRLPEQPVDDPALNRYR